MRTRVLTSLLCIAAAVAPACAPRSHAPADAEPAFARVDAAAAEQIALLMRMEDARTLDTALVARLLTAPQPEVRGRAALAAGRSRDRAATPLLLQALADAHPAVRARAAFAAGELGDSAAAVTAALAVLAVGPAPEPASEAVAAVGQIGSPAGRHIIDAVLSADESPAVVREAALLAAWRLPRASSTVAAVRRWTTHPQAETRWRAVYALSRMGGADVAGTLLDALADDDDRVRANALRGLRAALVDSAALRPRVLPALLRALEDPHPHVRITALRLLPGYRDPGTTTPALLRGLRDVDTNVRVTAAQALADTAAVAAAPALRDVVADASAPDALRSAALAAWARIDPAAAVAAASAWADSSRWLLRYNAARALGSARWPHGAALLQRLARDQHHLVAAEALGAIRTAADTAADARNIYVERLAAAHPLVRAAAARGLERIAGTADLDLLLQAFDRARQDTIPDAALAVVDALGAAAAAGAPVHRAFYVRFGAAPPAEAALQRAIASRIGAPPATWTAPPAGPQPRPLSYYRDVVERLVLPALHDAALPLVAIATPHGEILLELAAADAPLTVHNFLSLVDRGYYTGTRWHRVVPNFVIQDGDPRGDGLGGPGYAIRDEINPLRYDRGVLGMALSGPDTGGSQFFITHAPQPHLDGGYTVFGRVRAGMDTVDRVVQDEPILGFRRVQP